MSNHDQQKSIEEINEEIERQFETNDFDEPTKQKPQFLSFRFLFTLIILCLVVYRVIRTMI